MMNEEKMYNINEYPLKTSVVYSMGLSAQAKSPLRLREAREVPS